MIVSRSRTVGHAIRLDGNDIVSLRDILRESYKSVTVSAEGVDGGSFHAKDDLKEILDWPNPSDRKFKRMSFYGSNEQGFDDYCDLTIATSKGLWINTITAFINLRAATDKQAVTVSEALEEKLRHTKPAYSFFATSPLVAWALLLGLLIFAVASMAFGSQPVQITTPMLIGSILLGGIGGPLLERAKNWVFPPVFFSIGLQKKTEELLGWWRTAVMLSLVVGVIGSIIAALILQ